MKKDQQLSSAFSKRIAKETKKSEKKVTAPAVIESFVNRFTQEKLDAWKKEFGNRELIALVVNDKQAVLRPPTADDLSDYMLALGTEKISTAVAATIQSLWIDGDFELIDDEDNFCGVVLQMHNILETKKADFFRI